MLFGTYTFLIFFVCTLIVALSIRSWRWRKVWLLLSSYVFYAAWNPPFVLLLWLSTLVDWTVAKRLHVTQTGWIRRLLLVASLGTNLGLLGYFKYGGFIAENALTLLSNVGFSMSSPELDIILPVGISFYTFQTLSYTIDVYRGRMKPSSSFLDFALYVTFFPQLVAGPIVRAEHFLPQCQAKPRVDFRAIGWGMCLMVVGVFNKLVIADALMSPIVEAVYDTAAAPTFISTWAGTFAFATQIFCDFSGYSTCAIGVAMCLGFALPDNFRFPYAAIGFSDFWQRWHISLSSWLRDYLYIPLGGNRRGLIRTYINLMTTMLLGGLWHGASWNFVIWGGLHGGYLCLERVTARAWTACGLSRFCRLTRLLGVSSTFLLVNVAWVFFRAPNLADAVAMIRSMASVSMDRGVLSPHAVAAAFLVAAGLLIIHWLMRHRTLESVASKIPYPILAVILSAMVMTITICATTGQDRAFIYFQF